MLLRIRVGKTSIITRLVRMFENAAKVTLNRKMLKMRIIGRMDGMGIWMNGIVVKGMNKLNSGASAGILEKKNVVKARKR